VTQRVMASESTSMASESTMDSSSTTMATPKIPATKTTTEQKKLKVNNFPSALQASYDAIVTNSYKNVYELLQREDMKEALTLPPESIPLDNLLSRIEITFIKDSDPVHVSETHSGSETRTKVDIYYSDREVQKCPGIITARVVHEAAHSLRKQYVRQYWEMKLAQDKKFDYKKDKYDTNTPPMKLEKMKHLFQLESEHFHSGYVAEHRLFGGILCEVFGICELDDGKEYYFSRMEPAFFLVETSKENAKKVSMTSVREFRGFWADGSSIVPKGKGSKVTIFCEKLNTRSA